MDENIVNQQHCIQHTSSKRACYFMKILLMYRYILGQSSVKDLYLLAITFYYQPLSTPTHYITNRIHHSCHQR